MNPIKLLAASLLLTAPLAMAMPGEINYQAALFDENGSPVSGNKSMSVRLYDEEEQGNLVYEEDLGTVEVIEGVYSFQMGANGTLMRWTDEWFATTDGNSTSFTGTPNSTPDQGSLSVTDGQYQWSEWGGSSNASAFNVDYSNGNVTVTYGTAPSAGKELVFNYSTREIGSIFTVEKSADYYLAVVVDGVEQSTRTRILTVPFAFRAKQSDDAQSILKELGLLVGELNAAGLLKSVYVEGGTLPDESKLAGQEVSSFIIGKYEVTWDEWQKVREFAVQNGYDLGGVGEGSAGDHPVRNVGWFDVVKWCNAKSEMEGLSPVYLLGEDTYMIYKSGTVVPAVDSSASGFRLPSEAEWDWASRGGNKSKGYVYSGGDNIWDVGWYLDNSWQEPQFVISEDRGTRPVGQKSPNELGIYDMSGNVWEWCQDPVNSTFRRMRGGSWFDSADYSALNNFQPQQNSESFSDGTTGFRWVRNFEL
jgi:formylglycine-generating enzyme required for sulfatase activity